MKKFLAVLLIFLCFSTVFAEDGVFVPSFSKMMDSFYNSILDINQEYANLIYAKCYKDGMWVEHEESRIYSSYNKPHFQIQEGHGYLFSLRIEYDEEIFVDNEDEFKAILISVYKALLPEYTEEDFSTFWDDIYYDYVIDSPASGISMYTNFGVYQLCLNKTWGNIYADIRLSVYEN